MFTVCTENDDKAAKRKKGWNLHIIDKQLWEYMTESS